MDLDQLAKSFPTGNGGATLQAAAWHLQTILMAIGGTDSKVMFLTALNAAGLSALVGIVVTSSPPLWLSVFGFTALGMCVVIGLGRLWAAEVPQFPSPDQVWEASTRVGEGADWLQWQLFLVVREAAAQADNSLQRSTMTMRIMLAMTPMSLALVVAAALTAIR